MPTFSPVLFLALRFTLATVALLVLFRGSWSHPRNPRGSLGGGALAGIFLFSGYAFQTIGLQYRQRRLISAYSGVDRIVVAPVGDRQPAMPAAKSLLCVRA